MYNWSGREDLNLRHPVPKTGALPGCATSRTDDLFIVHLLNRCKCFRMLLLKKLRKEKMLIDVIFYELFFVILFFR